MARLPSPGGDDGNWGTILNEYLEEEHNSDGSHGLASGLVTDVVNTQADVGTDYTLPAPIAAGIHYLTLTTNCNLTLPAAVAGQSFTVVIKQGGSGSNVITWLPSAKWEGGIAPTLSSAVGTIDIIGFFCPDASNWFGFVSGQNMS